MDLDPGRFSGTSDYAEPIPDQDLDWTWPAADTFTDDSIAQRTFQTCSELGSQRIRLTKIRPGRPRDTIKCDTKVCFLSEAGEYTALSYTWGIPVERCQIVVDEQPRMVTVNLCRFLWQARQLSNRFSGWLWIDALSIQQSDPWEKLEQVKLLSAIFARATDAVVWLGPAYGNSDRAMKALAAQRTKQPRWKAPRSVWASPVSSAMLELCDRPYWYRLWVFQELKASQTTAILCGSSYVHLDSLESLMYDDNDERVKVNAQALQNSSAARMLRLVHASMDRSLRAMLDSTNHLRCTDPRDKVYAILNVVSSGHQGIEADYTSTLPTLMNQILRNMHVAEKPTTLLDVAMQCKTLEGRFGMSYGSIFKTKGDDALAASLEPLDLLYIADCWGSSGENIDLVPQALGDVHSWCKDYDHHVVAQLVRRVLPSNWCLDELSLELNKRRLDAYFDMLSSAGLSDKLATVELCEEISRILKSFERICKA